MKARSAAPKLLIVAFALSGGVRCDSEIAGPAPSGSDTDGSAAPRDCGPIAHGTIETRVCYSAASAAAGEACVYAIQSRRCDDGAFVPDYPACEHLQCGVAAPPVVAIVDRELLELSDLGLAPGDYSIDTLLAAVVGRANRDSLRAFYIERGIFHNGSGNTLWLEDALAALPPGTEVRVLHDGADLLATLGDTFEEILTYPKNPVDWRYDGAQRPAELPLADGAYSWIDEKYNHNRFLALNFVNLRRALPVPEAAVTSVRALLDLPVHKLSDAVESLHAGGWTEWSDLHRAQSFLNEHLFDQLNAELVCLNTAYDVCVAEDGLALGGLHADLYHLADIELIDAVLARHASRLPPNRFGALAGWSGSEDIYGCLASRHDYGITYELSPGLSALHKVPTRASSFDLNDAQLSSVSPTFSSSGKYVALVISDGNGDWLLGRMGGGWDEYHEGLYARVPLTWQLRADVLSYAPLLAQHFYDTRFATDRFMMGPSGPTYIHFAGLRDPAGLARYGAHLEAARGAFGLDLYEAWGGYHPRVDAIFDSATNPYDPGEPNPFPALIQARSWSGDPRQRLGSLLACRLSPSDEASYPAAARMDALRAVSPSIQAIVDRSPGQQVDVFDARPTAFLLHPLDTWNYYPRRTDSSLDVALVADRVSARLASGAQFGIVTGHLYDATMAGGLRVSELVALAQLLAQRGVTLVTMHDYLALKRQCRASPPGANASCQ